MGSPPFLFPRVHQPQHEVVLYRASFACTIFCKPRRLVVGGGGTGGFPRDLAVAGLRRSFCALVATRRGEGGGPLTKGTLVSIYGGRGQGGTSFLGLGVSGRFRMSNLDPNTTQSPASPLEARQKGGAPPHGQHLLEQTLLKQRLLKHTFLQLDFLKPHLVNRLRPAAGLQLVMQCRNTLLSQNGGRKEKRETRSRRRQKRIFHQSLAREPREKTVVNK